MKKIAMLNYIMYLISCFILGLIIRNVTDNILFHLLFCVIGPLILWIVWMHIIPQISQRILSSNRR